MKRRLITIIGGGNMGTAVLQAMLSLRGISPKDITVVERSLQKRKSLASHFSIRVTNSLAQALKQSGVVLLAVKPQDFAAIAPEIKHNFSSTGLIISIMAGVRISTLCKTTGCSRIVRVMPNLPMIMGEGFSVWQITKQVTAEQKSFIRVILNAGGEQRQIFNEKIFDAVTAVSGSGPAYVFSLAADLMAAAENLGITKEVARKMVAQTIMGSAAILKKSSDSPAVWRQRVTSKGGTTAAALKVLAQSHLSRVWLTAVRAAARRSYLLSGLIDKKLNE